jgi:ribosomal protein S18 acetylase RimI-like enzyme
MLDEAECIGLWAERLAAREDQTFVVAETERYEGRREVVGFARVQRGRPVAQVTGMERARLLGTTPAGSFYASEEKRECGGQSLVGPRYDAQLMNMYVMAEFQRMGIGTQLLRTAFALVRNEWGVGAGRRIYTWAGPEGQRLYTRHGGRRIGLDSSHTAYAFDLDKVSPPSREAMGNLEASDDAEATKGRGFRHFDQRRRKWVWVRSQCAKREDSAACSKTIATTTPTRSDTGTAGIGSIHNSGRD